MNILNGSNVWTDICAYNLEQVFSFDFIIILSYFQLQALSHNIKDKKEKSRLYFPRMFQAILSSAIYCICFHFSQLWPDTLWLARVFVSFPLVVFEFHQSSNIFFLKFLEFYLAIGANGHFLFAIFLIPISISFLI